MSNNNKNKNIEDEVTIDDIAESVGKFLLNNSKSILILVIVGLIGASGYGFSNYLKNKEVEEATNAYYQIEKQIQDIVKEKNEQQKKEQEEYAKTHPKEKAKEPTELKLEYKGVLDKFVIQFGETAKEYSGNSFNAFALAKMANFLHTQEYTNHAIELIEANLKYIKKESLGDGLLRIQFASYLMDAKNYEKAIEQLKEVNNNSSTPFLHGESLLKIGVCHQMLNNKEKAVEYYTQTSEKFPDKDSGKSAKKYLRILSLN